MFREKKGACSYTFTSDNGTKKQPLIKTEMRRGKKHLKMKHTFMPTQQVELCLKWK